MTTQSLRPTRGEKRTLCSCSSCESNVETGSCEFVFPPTKRRRLEEASTSYNDDNFLARLFTFNDSDNTVFASDDPGYTSSEDDRDGETDSNDGSESDGDNTQPSNGQTSTKSRRSNYGNNMYNCNEKGKRKGLRPIVIDGSNVAMGHTNGRYFSCKGLKICVDYFLKRNHRVYVIVPHFRQCHGQARDQYILRDLFQKGHLFFTPSRMVNGRLEVPYDDRYIVQLAAATGGVIVSSDRYRDLLNENPRWAETIKNRLLMFTWVEDILFFPQDPFGKHGPSLDELLRF